MHLVPLPALAPRGPVSCLLGAASTWCPYVVCDRGRVLHPPPAAAPCAPRPLLGVSLLRVPESPQHSDHPSLLLKVHLLARFGPIFSSLIYCPGHFPQPPASFQPERLGGDPPRGETLPDPPAPSSYCSSCFSSPRAQVLETAVSTGGSRFLSTHHVYYFIHSFFEDLIHSHNTGCETLRKAHNEPSTFHRCPPAPQPAPAQAPCVSLQRAQPYIDSCLYFFYTKESIYLCAFSTLGFFRLKSLRKFYMSISKVTLFF